MTALNLFALTGAPQRQVLRLPLSAEVQAEVTATFRQQEAAFRARLGDPIPFDGKYTPEEDEALVIAPFTGGAALLAALANPLGVPEIAPSPAAFAGIRALFSGDPAGPVALIQHFERGRILSNAGLSLFHAANVYRKVDGIGLTLATRLTALLEGERLHFVNFSRARQIFDLSAHYREATDADLDAFAALPLLQGADAAALRQMADSVVRRKVALLLQSPVLRTLPVEEIAQAAAEFGVPVRTQRIDGQDRILLPQDKASLKALLRFLDEDYFRSVLLRDLYLTNSRRRLR